MKNLVYILFFFSLSGFSNEEPPFYELALNLASLENKHVTEIYLEMFEEGAIDDLPDCIGSANLWLNDFGKPYYATYFVTAGATGSGSGTEGSPFTIAQANSADAPGDIIRVKAGNYGPTNYTFSTSGTSGNTIQWIGYKTTPGDITASNGSTFVYGEDSYTTADYPTFVGTRSGGNVTGTAITVNASYVEIHNFQFKDKEKAINSFGNFNVLNNNIMMELGNHGSNVLEYSGTAIFAHGTGQEITNNFALNVNAQAYTFGSKDFEANEFEVHYNWAGCDQNISDDYSTDYYILGFQVFDSNFSNNIVYREPGQHHQGHGLILKGTAENNTFTDNELYYCPLEFSFEGVRFNTVQGGIIDGTGTEGGNVDYAFILIGNGANNNTFKNMTVTGDVGVRFSDWDDGFTPSPDNDIVSAGYDNLFQNIIFRDLRNGIEFAWHWFGTGTAVDNVFDNCLFYNITGELFSVERANTGTILRNCAVVNSPASLYEGGQNEQARPAGTNYPLNVTWIDGYAFNNGFTIPGLAESGTAPGFTNDAADDYTLQSGSPLINAGSTATTATTDFNGDTRDASPDIGPYEFGGGGPIAVTGVKITPSSITTNGTTAQFYKIVFPLTADDQTGTWSSDNGSAATVNSSGLATEVADGQADIEFESTDGSFTDSGSVTFSNSYVPDAFEAIGPLLYLQPNSVDPDVTVDANPTSIWEDMSGNGLNAFPQGTIDLNLNGSDRSAEHSGTSYWLLPDDSSLNLVPGTDEIYVAVREGPVSTSGSGYMLSKAGASDRQFGISYSGGELEGVYVGGVFNAFSGVPTGTRRFVEIMATTTTVSAKVDGIYVLVDAAIGTATNPGQPWNIGGRTNGSYLVTAGAQFDLVVIDNELPDAGELEAIQEQFNVNSAPEPGEENITIRGIYLSTSKSGGLYLGSVRLN